MNTVVASAAYVAIPLALLPAAFSADVSLPAWRHLSSKNGDLPPPNGGTEQTACVVADIDKDGRNDIILVERSQAPAIVWLRPNGQGWTKYVVEADKVPIAAGGTLCDVDGDGDLDLVFGSPATGSEVWWWENPYPQYDPRTPWQRHIIKNTGKGMHHDQLAGDFLGEGRPQIVSWFQGGGTLLLFKIPDDPRQNCSWPTVTVAAGIRGGEGLAMGDIDGDGQPEIVGGGRWFKHLGGGQFASCVIDNAQTNSRAAVGCLKEGGPPQVVLVPGDGVGRLKWYEYRGDPRETTSWIGHDLLGADVNHGHSLQIADINGDGHLDIFCAEMAKWSSRASPLNNPDAKAWIFYGDGKGNFTKTELATSFDFHEAKVADIDGEGRLDIVNKPFLWDTPRIDVWLNQGGRP